MSAPTLPYHVYAICAGSGPVVIGSYGSASDQRRAYRDALATLQDGGYDRDVVRIELGSGEPRHVSPAIEWPTATVQLALL